MAALELKIPPVAVTVLFAALMWLAALLTPGNSFSTPTGTVTALLLIAAAGGVGLSAVASFRRSRTTVNPFTPETSSTLVDTGIYRWSRNPMYLALLLALLGWAAFLGNLLSLVLAGGFVPYMNRFQIGPEEKALEAGFGETFRQYRRQVRRWL